MTATLLTGALGGVAVLLATGVTAVFGARLRYGSALAYATAFVVCAALSTAALAYLLSDSVAAKESVLLPIGLPWLGAHFDVDRLTAVFLLVTNVGGAAASLYGLGIGRHEPAVSRVVPFFPLYIAAMNLLVLAGDAFSYLLSWEFMSLTSWALVMAHHEEDDNRVAGYLYLVMASFGTLALLLAFGLLAPTGAYAFADIRALDHDHVRTGIVFLLVLIGCGSKAGLVPLHAWLPLAHPAAPSHVSALMSGVMTKVAIYGFIRIVFDLLGPPQTWWSVVVLTIGGVTAVLGVLHAMLQDDLKRLLAFSTVENVGIIFIGLGLALAFESGGIHTAAALALVAALFHVFNHSLFKSLLFFGAGAVHATTHQRDMEHLGGLIHRMPVTAFAFLAGSMAISALPPLNGFVSEWLTFQAILVSPQLSAWGLKFLIPAVGAMLALSAALVAACFVRAFGLAFLGRPRSSAAQVARDANPAALASMLALVAMC
jgi:formate hydrogenlyase subunit 3/multisubunit Na+/H+ antiporter MnhD subunit